MAQDKPKTFQNITRCFSHLQPSPYLTGVLTPGDTITHLLKTSLSFWVWIPFQSNANNHWGHKNSVMSYSTRAVYFRLPTKLTKGSTSLAIFQHTVYVLTVANVSSSWGRAPTVFSPVNIKKALRTRGSQLGDPIQNPGEQATIPTSGQSVLTGWGTDLQHRSLGRISSSSAASPLNHSRLSSPRL